MWNIVIVDDEKLIADGLGKLIEHMGTDYKIFGKFNDPIPAWQFIKKNINSVDLLITDIRMPGISGLQLIEKAHRLRPGLQCALLTGFGEFEYAKEAIRLGVVSYILKPIDSGELKELLDRLITADKRDSSTVSMTVLPLSKEVLAIKKEIEENYRFFDINDVAERLHLSRDYLFRLFKKETGQNVTDYLTSVRMEKAKEMLGKVGEYKAYEVSELVGYSDYAYFSKLYKKIIGVSPKAHQKYISHAGENE